MPDRTERAVAAVAAFGLEDAPADPGDPGDDWQAFVAKVTAQRLCGLALAFADAGKLDLPARWREELERRHLVAMVRSLALERRLLDVTEALETAGIDAIVLKGPVLANAIYREASWRPFVDIDILVRGPQWRAACDLVAAIGFERSLPEPRAGFDERFGKAALHRDAVGTQLDLHQRLVLGPFGLWMQPGELFARAETFHLGGRALARLDDTTLLVHACMHASLGWSPPLPIPLRDVVEIARRVPIDWDRFVTSCRRWRLGAVVAHAAESVRARLGVALPELEEAARAVPASRSERRALEAYTVERRARGGISLVTLKAIPRVRDKVAYVGSMLLPDQDFLAARSDRSRPSYLRRWRIAAGWVARPKARG